MAVKTLYIKNATASGSNHGSLQDGGTAPATGTTGTGWTVSNLAATRYAVMDYAVERTSGNFSTTAPTAAPNNTLGDCFRTESALAGSFAATNWTFRVNVVAVTAGGSQDGRVRVRLWKSRNADGSDAVALTAAVDGTTLTNISTTASSTWTSSGTLSPGAFTCQGEYLFLQVIWVITGPGGGTTADVLIRTSSADSVVTTADFTAQVPVSLVDDGTPDVTLTQASGSNTGLNSVSFSTPEAGIVAVAIAWVSSSGGGIGGITPSWAGGAPTGAGAWTKGPEVVLGGSFPGANVTSVWYATCTQALVGARLTLARTGSDTNNALSAGIWFFGSTAAIGVSGTVGGADGSTSARVALAGTGTGSKIIGAWFRGDATTAWAYGDATTVSDLTTTNATAASRVDVGHYSGTTGGAVSVGPTGATGGFTGGVALEITYPSGGESRTGTGEAISASSALGTPTGARAVSSTASLFAASALGTPTASRQASGTGALDATATLGLAVGSAVSVEERTGTGEALSAAAALGTASGARESTGTASLSAASTLGATTGTRDTSSTASLAASSSLSSAPGTRAVSATATLGATAVLGAPSASREASGGAASLSAAAALGVATGTAESPEERTGTALGLSASATVAPAPGARDVSGTAGALAALAALDLVTGTATVAPPLPPPPVITTVGPRMVGGMQLGRLPRGLWGTVALRRRTRGRVRRR